MTKRKLGVLVAGIVAVSAIATAAALAGDNDSGFKTKRPSMLTPVMAGVGVTPLLTVGDVLPSGFASRPSRTGYLCAPRVRDESTSS